VNREIGLLERNKNRSDKWYVSNSTELILYMGAIDSCRNFNSDMCLMLLTVEDRMYLEVAHGIENEENYIGREIIFHKGFIGNLAGREIPAIINDTEDLESVRSELGEMINPGSVLASPLLFQNEMLGLMIIFRKKDQPPYRDRDLGDFIAYTNQFSISLGSQKLVNMRTRELHEMKKKLQRTNAKLKEEMAVRINALDKIKKQKILLEKKKDQLAERNQKISRINRELEEKKIRAERSERKVRYLIENVRQGIVIVQNGLIKFANPHFIRLTRIELNELNDMEFCSLFDREGARKIIKNFRNDLNEEEYKNNLYALKMKSIDGREIKVDIGFSIINYQGDNAFLIYIHDTTERDELQKRLMKSQKLESIGQLAAGIAHEINTPVQFVNDNVRFFEDAFHDISDVIENYIKLIALLGQDEKYSDMLKRIRQFSEEIELEYLMEEIPPAIEQSLDGLSKIAKIVMSMKDFAHSSGGNKEQVDLNKVIESTSILARNEYKYTAELELDLSSQLPLVNCDPDEMNQVILNMLVNSAHAIEEAGGVENGKKGKIYISSRYRDNHVLIEIQDTGAGISEENLSRIFDPFFTTKEVGKGSGQGLAISHQIIEEKHGGEIRVNSETGKGTSFIIKLPVEKRNPVMIF